MSARKVDFNRLPKSCREALVAVCSGQGPLRPLFADVASGGGVVGAVLLVLLGLGALAFFVLVDFARGSGAIQGPLFVIGYVIAFVFIFNSIASAWRAARLRAALPWRRGRYILPLDYVDATGRELEIIGLATMSDFGCTHHYTNGAYTHTAFKFEFPTGTKFFTVRPKAAAEQALEALRLSRRDVARRVEEGDVQGLARLDPLFEARAKDRWDDPSAASGLDSGQRAGDLPPWLGKLWLAALGAAILAGSVAWGARNVASDEVMFARAVRIDDERAYRT